MIYRFAAERPVEQVPRMMSSPARPSRATISLVALVALGSLTVVPLVALNPFDPSEAKAEARQLVGGVIGNLFLAFLAALALTKAASFRARAPRVSLTLLGLGLCGTTLGGFTWTYYHYANVADVPYPGPADVFYLGAVALIAAAFLHWLLSIKRRLEGYEIGLVVGIPLIVGTLMYTFFIADRLSTGSPLVENVLSVAFAAGDAVYVMLALLVFSLHRDGPHRGPLRFLALGLLTLALADTVFSFAIANDWYFAGSWVDLLYWGADLLLGVGLWSFRPAPSPAPGAPDGAPAPGASPP